MKQNEQNVRTLVAEEATMVADVFYDLERFDEAATVEARRLAVRYAGDVVRLDWPKLEAERAVSEEGWRTWRALIERTLDLRPADRRQELIQDRLVSNIYALEDKRQEREIHANVSPHPGFWISAIAGLMIICACFAPYPSRTSTYVFIALFAGFTGAVLYLAYDISKPFSGLSSIQPTFFEDFISQPRPAELAR